ncbi:phosphotransferase family protein [Thalassomonas haliotis]|uniref:Phosphotransferase family protein n=1 Tax=Thalassomonas haliotis TaxID=485448 RepID=A0ABY7V8H1_9GAMM|nr:phosphotransferase family protein [Thalassomonas haliotis]WDE09866.1 phosphotransferase family protein [Thalassomonas haliotis]
MSQISPMELEKLTEYLAAQITGFQGPLQLKKFTGGQSNPTYKLSAKSGDYVLRSQPRGKLLKSAHAVDREYRVLAALKNSQIPVPKVFHLCEDKTIIGAMFYLMEFCDGRVYWDAALQQVQSNAVRSEMYDAMNRVLVDLHQLDIHACGLSDYAKAGNYFQRQLTRWSSQYRASELQKNIAMDELNLWLEQSLPEDDGRICLVHGDFRLDNIMFHRQKPDIIAVLDWELSTLGHPFADLAYQCMQLRMPQGMGTIDGLQGINRASLGIPSEQAYVERYCQRMNLGQIDNWSFYLAFSFFRLAAIAQGIAKRASQGNASNKDAAKAGAFVQPLALMALEIINKENVAINSY